jgi:hypothetical protein
MLLVLWGSQYILYLFFIASFKRRYSLTDWHLLAAAAQDRLP